MESDSDASIGSPENVEANVGQKRRRQKNLETWGGNCNQEAQYVRLLRSEMATCGIEVVILNDYTVADVILRPSASKEDRWLPVQVKTTRGARPPRDDAFVTVWRFSNMQGYAGMPILCAVVSSEHRWLMIGQDWFPKDIEIGSRKSKYSKLLTRVDESQELASRLIAMYNDEGVDLVYEWSARWNIARETHRVEMQSVMLWVRHVCEPNGWSYRWPEGQGLCHDLEYSVDNSVTWKRVQMKTLATHSKGSRASGFSLPLQHQAGYNDAGKPTHRPYSVGDADVYVGMRWNNEHFDVWTFDENELAGYLATGNCPGKVRMSVHLPSELSNERVNDGVSKSKGGPMNKTLWTRGNHVRYARS